MWIEILEMEKDRQTLNKYDDSVDMGLKKEQGGEKKKVKWLAKDYGASYWGSR